MRGGDEYIGDKTILPEAPSSCRWQAGILSPVFNEARSGLLQYDQMASARDGELHAKARLKPFWAKHRSTHALSVRHIQ